MAAAGGRIVNGTVIDSPGILSPGMKLKMRTLAALAALLVGLYLAWGYFFPTYTSRFRLTIEIETPEGMKSGSSVIETRNWETSWGPVEARGLRSSARGEAVFVDLGKGRNVIAILGWGPFGQDTQKIYGLTRAALAPGRRVSWKDEPQLKGSGELPREYVPTLISFSDLSDPRTARIVPPTDFSSIFGAGVRFRSAHIETTNDAVTRGIEMKLPWWTLPGRPAGVARRAWLGDKTTGPAVEPEKLFIKD
jgi:hypothetical protein